jgi:membrane-associated protease RseP (regulator of RpoE activity)
MRASPDHHSPAETETGAGEPTGSDTGAVANPPIRTSGGSARRIVFALVGVAALTAAGLGAAMIALAVLLTLILLHEGGHFLAARACRMRVHQFFVGFGPVVWSTTRGETEYGVKAIPLGGFVRIAGMSDADRDDPRGYGKAGRFQKLAVVAAGPVANLVVALVVGFFVLFALGLPTTTTTLSGVDPSGPAYVAGLRAGDTVVAVDGAATGAWDDVVAAVERAGQTATVEVDRDGTTVTYPVAVEQVGGVNRIGVNAGEELVRKGFVESITGSVEVVRFVSGQALQGIGALVTGFGNTLSGLAGGDVNPENRPLSPVGAIQVGTSVGSDSVHSALTLVIIYSVFLAVFNLLPIPPLDGGHMAIVAVESALSAIRRRKVEVPQAVIQRIAGAFVVALLFVGAVALVLDITQPIKL